MGSYQECNDSVSVRDRDRLKNMAKTVTMNRHLEYTTAGDIILAQSGKLEDPKPTTSFPDYATETQ